MYMKKTKITLGEFLDMIPMKIVLIFIIPIIIIEHYWNKLS